MSGPVTQTSSGNVRNHVMTRRRAHILERAQAQFSNPRCRLTATQDDRRQVSQATEDISLSYVSDFGSRSESSMEPGAPISDRDSFSSVPEERSEHRVNGQPLEGQQPYKKPRSRAWYEFDLAVLVALVSPVGHWLTGGDHIKNLFMLILLIYYLHQIIEVPWTVYQKARLQRPLPRIPPTTIEEKFQQIAASELRKIELLFLFLAALSPFLGAAFLRYATGATIGPEAVSWFNVGLFVLATGMRPWAHIVERLKQRTNDLHEVAQHPISPQVVAATGELADQLDRLTRRISKLEKNNRRNEAKTMELVEDVYHDIDEFSERLEGLVRKHEKKQARHEARMKDIEDTLKHTRNSQARQMPIGFRLFPISLLRYVVPSWLSLSPYRVLIHAIYATSASLKSGSSPSQSSPAPKSAEEEEYPVLAQPTHLTSGVLSRVGYIAMLPLRTVLRMILRRY